MTESTQAPPPRPGKGKFIVGGLIIHGCVCALITVSTGLSLDFYSSVSEFLAGIDSYKGGAVRVRGIVQADSVRHDDRKLDTEFVLVDNDASLRVFYHGVLPSSFVPGRDLVVQGTYSRQKGLFVANQLMFKCPSKYESPRGAY